MVKNMGTAPLTAASKLGVSFTVNDTQVGSLEGLAQPLLPGQARLLAATTNNWKASASGNVTLAAAVDSGNTISEWLETNNQFSRPLKVY
jgi:subtilase family serine protease